MEEQVERLVEKAWNKFQDFDESKRLLLAISGIPGSGKTTLAASVVSGLNKKYHNRFHKDFPNSPECSNGFLDPSQPDIAYCVPLDGYHLTRKQLSEMPNAEEAIFRRGAAFTFDSQSYYGLVKKLRQPIEATTSTVYAPSFDHAVKDPVENDIGIPKTARIVVFEGLYVAMDREGWRDAAELMDEVWYIETSLAVAEARVAKRNFAAGISATLEDSLARTRASDMRNAKEVMAERLPCQEVIKSIEDDTWKSEEVEVKAAAVTGAREERPNGGMRQRQDSIAELAEAGAGW